MLPSGAMPKPLICRRTRLPILATPRSKWAVLALAMLLFLTAPVVIWHDIDVMAREVPGAEFADSISFIFLIVMWFVTAPIVWGFIWCCLAFYPGSVPLTAWNRARPVWSAAWTLLIGGAALAFAAVAPWSSAQDHLPHLSHAVFDVWLLLMLRSAVVVQPPFNPAAQNR